MCYAFQMVTFLLFVACKPAPEVVPPNLDELSRAALKNFDAEDEEAHITALMDWLNNNPTPENKGWGFDSIDEDTVQGLERDMEHCSDLGITGGAGVLDVVDGTVDMYAGGSLEEDQSFAEKSYKTWLRTFLEGEDGFLDGSDMKTDNAIEKSGPFGIIIPYNMFKDFRWVEVHGEPTMIARSVVPKAGFGEDGNNGILCGFTIEIWQPHEDGVLWYNGSWSRLKTIVDDIATEELLENELIKGTLDYYYGTEAHVNGYEAP
jgi:hypothetical protein